MDTEQLKDRDYTLMIGRSRASRDRQHPWYEEWIEAQTSLIDLVKECQKFDQDGLNIYDVSGGMVKFEKANVKKVAEILQDNHKESATGSELISLFEPLKDALNDYLNRKLQGKTKPRGEIIIAILDHHETASIDAIATLIIKATKSLDQDEELGISFIQIGDDEETRQFFTSLDDDLHRMGAQFDIVDTKYWHEIKRKSILQFLTEAITN